MRAQIPNLAFDNFATGNNIGAWYGYCTPVYDTGTSDAGDAGSAYFSNNLSAGTYQLAAFDCFDAGNPWYITTPVDFAEYTAIQFDVLWDTRSGLTIDQWNTGTNFQGSLFSPPGSEPQNYLATNGFITGMDIEICANGDNTDTDLGSIQIPNSAAFGWQTITIPLPPSVVGDITEGNGIIFTKWTGDGAPSLSTLCSWAFWLDNIVLVGGPSPPPPTLAPPIAAVPGLNIFNATEENSFNDRNEIVATQNSGLSWIGHPGASYSMTISGFPKNAAYGPEAYMFLVPNSQTEDNAPDSSEATCMILKVQSTPTGGQASLSYKVNDTGHAQDYVTVTKMTGSTTAGAVQSAKLIGTYSVTFTRNDAGYVTVPDGTTGAFALNGADGETYFTETAVNPYPFLIYLGGQANNASGIDQPVVYASFAATGVSNPLSETFTGKTALSGNWTDYGITTDISSIVMVPPTAPYWIAWSLPAASFFLENAGVPSAQGMSWNSIYTYSPTAMYGTNMQLIANADLQGNASIAQYFRWSILAWRWKIHHGLYRLLHDGHPLTIL